MIYFHPRGAIAVFTAYFASLGKGTVSAFIAILPILTALSFVLIFAEGGEAIVEEYARGLLLFTLPWICYVGVVLLGTQRLGILKSAGLSILFISSSLGWCSSAQNCKIMVQSLPIT